jgi:hypothetical protein
MRRALLVAAALAACRPQRSVEPSATPAVGIALALYQRGGTSYAVVDDRRWVTVEDGEIVLDAVDPGASLPSLVIEPLAGSPISVGACTRDQVSYAMTDTDALRAYAAWQERRTVQRARGEPLDPEPTPVATATSAIRCAVRGEPGRYLVRVLYVSPSLRYGAQHDIEVTAAERATIASRYTISTPAWQTRAQATLFHGVPGGERAPKLVAKGEVTLDGSTAILAAPPREVTARVRWIYRGAFRANVDSDETAWGRDSRPDVWTWLELVDTRLPPGPVHARIAVPGEPEHDVQISADGRVQHGDTLELPLWTDPSLRGIRHRTVTTRSDGAVIESFTVSLSSSGDTAREVWIEEPLRTAKRRFAHGAWPVAPELAHDLARLPIVVPPGGVARARFGITSEP